MSIRIGTSELGGTFYTQGLALKTVLDRFEALAPVEVRASMHASIGNANDLNSGNIDFGFMAANWIGRALNGEKPFVRSIALRMVAPMNAGPLFFIARADSSIRTVADLRGKRVVVGARNSGMAQHAHTILGVLGFGFAGFTPVYLDFAAGAEALAAGSVDAQFQCPIPNRVMTDLSQRVDIRVLPYGSGQLDKVLKAVSFYRPTVIRKGAIRALDADVPQIAVLNVLVTHARAAESTVGTVVREIASAAEELGQLNPLFAGLGELFRTLRSEGSATFEFGGVPFHPGARRAYREIGFLNAEFP